MKELFKALKELLEYVFSSKKYWLIPTILALIILGLLISTGGSTAVPVFAYPVF
ncbi:MAG: hypothetical protein H8Z69_05630 [Nanohaloarchaea archaeon]|nr:hypothetical protein [Candidatus Nanohaloarchaea archaeon]